MISQVMRKGTGEGRELTQLKVIGMYHCSGPVTSMKILRHSKMPSLVYIVAGTEPIVEVFVFVRLKILTCAVNGRATRPTKACGTILNVNPLFQATSVVQCTS